MQEHSPQGSRTAWRRSAAWLLGALLLIVLAVAGRRLPYQALAPNDTVNEGVLCLEGWLPDGALERAVALFRTGQYSHLAVTGSDVEYGVAVLGVTNYAHFSVDRLRALQVPEVVILCASAGRVRVNRTEAHALALRQALAQAGLATAPVDVYTEGLHARRSRMLYQRALGPDARVGVWSDAQSAGYDANDWWASSEGVKGVVTEWISLLYTVARGDSWQATGRRALWLSAAGVLAYLLGSLPIGLLVARTRGVDIRRHGSGNIGATNVFRVCGRGWGLLTFAGDMLKGLLPALLLPLLLARLTDLEPSRALGLFLGCLAVAGHNWSIFLHFTGGKGVATSCGMLLGVAPAAVGIGLVVWIVLTLTSRYVSLGSIGAALAVAASSWRLYGNEPPLPAVLTLMSALIIWRHRANVVRLCRGEENRFSFHQRKDPPPS